jgi:hypothetical protein
MSELGLTDWAKLESIPWEARADSADVAALVEQSEKTSERLETIESSIDDLIDTINKLIGASNNNADMVNKLIEAVNSQREALLKLAEALKPREPPNDLSKDKPPTRLKKSKPLERES